MSVSKTLTRKGYMIAARYSGLTKLLAPIIAGQGAILMLHRVGRPLTNSGLNGFLSVEGGFLNGLLGALKADGISFVTMDEAIDRIKSGHKDERFITVTLDDGYRDNLLTAAPIFANHQVPYTIYACTGFCANTAILWWEIIAQIIDQEERISFATPNGNHAMDCRTPAEKQEVYTTLTDYLCTQVDERTQRELVRDFAASHNIDPDAHCRKTVMNWAELKTAAQDPLCTIGAHTLNHFHLARLSREEALYEAAHSAAILAAELGEKPAHFAYPYGGEIAAGEREADLMKEAGFTSAVTTRHGLIYPEHKDHLHALPRISVNGEYQRVHYVKTMLSGITVPVANGGRKFVTMGGV